MTETEFPSANCEQCGQPLFLNKKECKNFVENKLKQGYFVCKCCGKKQQLDLSNNQTLHQ